MNTHHQLFRLYGRVSPVVSRIITFNGKQVPFVSVCQVDKFFEQAQNKTALGFIDTSPYAASSPSAEQHVMPLAGGRKSSQLSDNDLFDTTVSKHCQTLSEFSNLAKAMHRPNESDYEEKVSEPSPTPAPAVE